MSNYVVVYNGLLKREKPANLPIVEFKDYRYKGMVDTLKKPLETVEVPRQPLHVEPLTIERIRQAIEEVYRTEIVPVVELVPVLDPTEEPQDDSPLARYRRGEITDVEYLDIISEDDNV